MLYTQVAASIASLHTSFTGGASLVQSILPNVRSCVLMVASSDIKSPIGTAFPVGPPGPNWDGPVMQLT